jgi:hypothetical protein
MKTFDQYTYQDVQKLFDGKRRPVVAVTATKFKDGDHYQGGEGFVGEMPPQGMKGYVKIVAMIEAGFISENVIGEVTENHIGGIFGREPIWSFLSDDGKKKEKIDNKEYAELTDWWNERDRLSDLQKAAEIVLCESIAVKHLFFPRAKVERAKGRDGKVPVQPNLKAGLDLIYCETLTADVAGVFTDPETQAQIGVCSFEYSKDGTEVKEKGFELSYLDAKGDTKLRVVKERGDPEDVGTYKLGGRLFVYEIRRKALITTQVQSNQKALNLALTMMMRNVNLAGARERAVSNAQPPKEKKKVADPDSSTGIKEIVADGVYVTGGGAVNFLMGWPIFNEKGQVAGYTNPNVTITDPAPVQTFVETRNQYYAAILGQCQQRHKLISGDATASSVSRQQARAEYESSLRKSKIPLDGAGRWELETTLRMAAQLSNQSEKYLGFRADFNCLIDAGVPDAETRRVVMEMRKPGGQNNRPLISDETARNWIGIDDAGAELDKIEAEKPSTDNPPPPPPDSEQPANGDSQVM